MFVCCYSCVHVSNTGYANQLLFLFCLLAIVCFAQVCGLLWNEMYGELISGHGYAKNQLTIWRYPHLEQVAELTGKGAMPVVRTCYYCATRRIQKGHFGPCASSLCWCHVTVTSAASHRHCKGYRAVCYMYCTAVCHRHGMHEGDTIL